jgi:hypothetical protein
MVTAAEAVPHAIYLAGKWVESPDIVEIANPARAGEPAGRTYNATPEQYEEAVGLPSPASLRIMVLAQPG